MIPYYIDTSALIKHYVAEARSEWLDSELFQAGDALLLTSRVTTVEAWSALARRKREASISSEHHSDALNAFRQDCQVRYVFVEFAVPVIEAAGKLLERHPLRAYDSVQLASALVAARTLAEAGFAMPNFVSADDSLLAIAQAEALRVDNPNRHT